MAENFRKIAKDPREIIKLNLAFSIEAADKFKRKTGYSREQVMVAFYGTGLDREPQIAEFHAQMKKAMQRVLYNLGESLQNSLTRELETLVADRLITVDVHKEPAMSFEDYCTVGALAVKYSTLKVFQDERGWELERRSMIRRVKGQKWLEAPISNDYAQFIVAQSLTETNYFEEAIDVSNKVLGLSAAKAVELFKHHVLLKPDQRQSYASVIQSQSDQMTQTRDSKRKLKPAETREALLYLTQVRAKSV